MASIPRALRRSSVDQDFLDACADLGSPRLADYSLFQSYYDGDQKVRLADRVRRFLEASTLPFAENFCEPVIDVLAERLEVEGFNALIGDEPAPDTFAQWLDRVWQRNRADALQGVVHTSVFVKGDAFVTVDYNPAKKLPRFTFNRPDVVKAVYSQDSPDMLDYVGKLWTTKAYGPQNEKRAAIQRLNVYYPDRVEKYYRLHGDTGGGGWEMWTDPADGGWPLPWVMSDGNPLGVAVVHFRNKPLGQTEGRSELRSVLPQQDALNKQIVDLHDILDNQAWPQRYVTGVVADTVDLTHKPGEYLHTAAADAKFGQLEAADPAGVLAAIEQTISRIARRSRTPLHLLVGGGLPSGEALKTAESGLVKKAERRAVDLGNSWEDVMLLAARVEAAYGKPAAQLDLDELVIETQWRNPQSRSEHDDFDWINAAVAAGVSEHSMQVRLGLDPEEELQHKASEKKTLDAAAGALLDAGVGANGSGLYAGTAVAA